MIEFGTIYGPISDHLVILCGAYLCPVVWAAYSYFSDVGIFITDITTDLVNGVDWWLIDDNIIWGGITVISCFDFKQLFLNIVVWSSF